MSGYARWKENRIRQEIHLAHLKHAKTSSNGAGVDGTYPLGSNGTSVRFLEQRPDTGSDKRTSNLEPKERESTSLDDSTSHPSGYRCSCLALGVLGPVRNPPMMPSNQVRGKSQ
jgi:hypothetical protein